jgi:mRNA-degrading endonuclease toxin of MazEF toxin-antitoxin module
VSPSSRLRQASDLLIDQVRAIDNRRFLQGPLTRLPEAEMARVGRALLEVLDLAEP